MSQPDPPKIGNSIQRLRRAQSLTLEDVSRRCGVSKSILSQIERDQTNPTLGTIWRLTKALGADLRDVLQVEETPRPIEHVPGFATPSIRSADEKCMLRILGPIDLVRSLEWYEFVAEPEGALISQAHEVGTVEHLSVFEGTLAVDAGDDHVEVATGDTVRYRADVDHAIRNPGNQTARAIMVVVLRPPSPA